MRLFTLAEAAALLCVSKKTLIKWRESGALPPSHWIKQKDGNRAMPKLIPFYTMDVVKRGVELLSMPRHYLHRGQQSEHNEVAGDSLCGICLRQMTYKSSLIWGRPPFHSLQERCFNCEANDRAMTTINAE